MIEIVEHWPDPREQSLRFRAQENPEGSGHRQSQCLSMRPRQSLIQNYQGAGPLDCQCQYFFLPGAEFSGRWRLIQAVIQR